MKSSSKFWLLMFFALVMEILSRIEFQSLITDPMIIGSVSLLLFLYFICEVVNTIFIIIDMATSKGASYKEDISYISLPSTRYLLGAQLILQIRVLNRYLNRND